MGKGGNREVVVPACRKLRLRMRGVDSEHGLVEVHGDCTHQMDARPPTFSGYGKNPARWAIVLVRGLHGQAHPAASGNSPLSGGGYSEAWRGRSPMAGGRTSLLGGGLTRNRLRGHEESLERKVAQWRARDREWHLVSGPG